MSNILENNIPAKGVEDVVDDAQKAVADDMQDVPDAADSFTGAKPKPESESELEAEIESDNGMPNDLVYETITCCGVSRDNNEDCLCVIPEHNIFMVADGMGGHLAGEVASSLTVNAVADYLHQVLEQVGSRPNQPDRPIEVLIDEAVQYANTRVFYNSHTSEECANMGSTLALAWQNDDRLYIAHVGDSRAYIFNRKQARQLTNDHSLVGDLLREGAITPLQALTHPKKNVLTRALGVEEQVKVDIQVFELPLPGFLLLCTDGMSSYLAMETVLPQVAASAEPGQILPILAELAKESGSNDDITGILLWKGEVRSHE